MGAIKSSIPLEQIIQTTKIELDELSERYEDLTDKGQVVFHLAQKISEKRKELESMQNFLQMKQKI